MIAPSSKPASLIYNLLIGSAWLLDHRLTSGAWRWAWEQSCAAFSGPVSTTIHGRRAIVNFGHPYPLNARLYSSFNAPLIELVHQTYLARKSPIAFVDVGASVGDTVLLLESACPEMIAEFICVDGDPEFFGYLEENLRHLRHGRLFLSLLSSVEGTERELVRTHRGTASAQGEAQVPASTLDSLLADAAPAALDVLKIDVDGFDGKVLKGAAVTLRRYRPAVIFEWHPLLCRSASNSWSEHFEALVDCGYERFVWFTKYGHFSHFMQGFDRRSVDLLAELSLRNSFHDDWHYDVIALPGDSRLSETALAESSFARARRAAP